MGQFKDISIKEVVEELNQSYFLPDIQREYVWLSDSKEKKIEELFDSILRGYPIGSFLFWKLKKSDIETNKDAKEDTGKLNFQLYKFIENYDQRKPHNEKVNIEQVNSDDLSVVLDGQQRLTSLYVGLKGTRTIRRPYAWRDNPNAYEEKRLYINLRYQPQEENPGDNFEFDFKKKEDVPKKDEKHNWFKVGDILEMGNITRYSREHSLEDGESDILDDLKSRFRTEHLISYFEEKEKNLDKVLKIFIRANSGGTQLSYSDLLMSILTATFSEDIRGHVTKFVDSIREQGFGVMGRDQILKTCLLLTDCNHIFQLRNFNKSNIKKIETNWEKITMSIVSGIKLLQEFGYRDKLSSAYGLSIVSYYIFKKGLVTKEDKNEIIKFIRNVQITGYFSASLDSKLSGMVPTMRDAENFSEINSIIKISSDDVEDMCDLQYKSPATFPVLQLLYPDLDYKNSTFHIDHIYPKSKFNADNLKEKADDYQKRANDIFNLQLLQGGENLSKGAKNPENWLKDEYGDDNQKIVKYKEYNYIDGNFSLEWGNIESFEEMRKSRIRAKLMDIFGLETGAN